MAENTGKEALLRYLRSETTDYAHKEGLMVSGVVQQYDDIRGMPVPYCERPMLNDGYDIFGVHWTRANPSAHYTQGQKPIITDIENWEDEVHFPDPSKFDWSFYETVSNGIDHERYAAISTLLSGPFERATMLSSFEDALANAIIDPDAFKGLMDAIADFKIEVINHMVKHGNLDIINLHDDWGTSKATFISPALWRQTIKPATQRMYDAIHNHGLIVAQHSCGRLEDIIDDVVEMGADVWEAQADVNDLDALDKKYEGKMLILHSPVGDAILPPGFDPNGEPDPEKLPPNMRPYPEPPAYLWR